MKVLLTGFSPRHVGRGVALGYDVIGDYVKAALEETGCTVDYRIVTPGERLEDCRYDAVVIGLMPPKANGARYMYGALWAMMNVHRCGSRLMFYVDDWQYYKILREARGQLADLGTMFDAHKRTCRASMDEALRWQDWLVAGLRAIAENEWPLTMYPSWRWGDTSIAARALPARELVKFDPTAWALAKAESTAPPPVSDDDRERSWVLATLGDKEPWLRKQPVTWPVKVFGGGGESVPEMTVRETIARSWGMLAPEYTHAGSGWWRVRVVNSVVARAVLLGGRAEMAAMGDEWVKARGPAIEEMSTGELRSLADAQWLSVRRWMTPTQESAENLRNAVERSKLSV